MTESWGIVRMMRNAPTKELYYHYIKHVTGSASFIDDIFLPKMVYACFVRSPYAHAKIRSIDFNDSIKNYGVLATLTGEEAAELSQPLPVYLYTEGEPKVPEWRCLPINKVNYVGEPVAAIVSENIYKAKDAAEVVRVDYEPLAAVVDVEHAIQETCPVIHETMGSNLAFRFRLKGGDIEGAFSDADSIVEKRFHIHRHAATPLEPRGIVADYERAVGRLTVWASTQMPFILRSHLSQILDIPENLIRVIAPDVGGGFGAKLQIAPEYIAVCILSILCGRPVKWIETRYESLATSPHAREQVHLVEAAFKNEGVLLGLRDRIIIDAGAYLDSRISGQAICSVYSLQGPYKIKAIDAEVSTVITNKCPYGPYRGFGLEAGTLITERLLDLAARRLGIGKDSIRRINLIKPDEMPFKTPLGIEYNFANYSKALDKALKLSEYKIFTNKYSRGVGSHIGIGIAFALEPTSVNAYTGTTTTGSRADTVDFGKVKIRIERDGRVSVYLGTASIGTGHAIAVAELISKHLGMSPNNINVIQGDTDMTPYDCGVRSSRFATVILPAVLKCVIKIREILVKTAAKILEANVGDIELKDGTLYVKDSPDKFLTISEIAQLFYTSTNKLPSEIEPTLEITSTFKPKKKGLFNTVSHSVHVAVVEVDDETGTTKVSKYVVVEDCGNVVVKDVVDSLVIGGVVQVIGGVFLERLQYDDYGQLLTRTLMDYLLPSATDIPSSMIVDHISTPSNLPGGFKGMAEGANIGGYAALINAVEDALRDLGVELCGTFLTSEKLFKVMKNQRRLKT